MRSIEDKVKFDEERDYLFAFMEVLLKLGLGNAESLDDIWEEWSGVYERK